MMGTKKLTAAAEDGVAAVKRADTSIKIITGLAAATLVVALITLGAVLVARMAAE